METRNQNKKRAIGAVFIGCMFMGMGVGMYFNKMTEGILVGMGIGFIASAIVKAKI